MKYLLVTFGIILCCGAAHASTSDEDAQRDFVRHLYMNKYYFRAITEAERFIFYYPKSPFIEDMKVLIADSYAQGGDEEKAMGLYLKFLNEYPGSSNVPRVYFKIGKLLAKNREYSAAQKYFEKILPHDKSSASLILKAQQWILLTLLLMDIDKDTLQKTILDYELTGKQELLSLIEEYQSLNFKSPTKSGILSALLPGAGQLYLNRKRDSAAAFLLNALFIWAIIESFENDNEGLGIVLLVFEAGWYGGNIYSAVNGAHKHNRKLKDSFQKRFSIGLNINVGKHHEPLPTLRFTYHF